MEKNNNALRRGTGIVNLMVIITDRTEGDGDEVALIPCTARRRMTLRFRNCLSMSHRRGDESIVLGGGFKLSPTGNFTTCMKPFLAFNSELFN